MREDFSERSLGENWELEVRRDRETLATTEENSPVQEPGPRIVKIEELADKALEVFPTHLFIVIHNLELDMIERCKGTGVDTDHDLWIRNTLFALELEGLQGHKMSLDRHRYMVIYLLRVKNVSCGLAGNAIGDRKSGRRCSPNK